MGLVLAAGAACGGELGKLTLKDPPLAVLGGRVLVKMPEGAKVEARKTSNIMGSDPSPEEEGRIILDSGAERLVVMARETFQWAGKDLPEVLAKQYAGAVITPLPAAAKAGPTSYLVVPKEVKPGGAATSVATACLVLPDKTVVRLEAYANPAACKDLAGCTVLAKEILSRAAGGAVPLNCAAGPRRLRSIVTGKEVQVDLPANYVATTQRGPDFWVTYVRPLAPLGEATPSLVLYQGAHPRAFHTKGGKEGAPPPKVESADGTFLGKKTSWVKWTNYQGGQPWTCTEAIVSFKELESLHVYYAGRDAEEMARYAKIAQGMTLVDKAAEGEAKPAPAANADRP